MQLIQHEWGPEAGLPEGMEPDSVDLVVSDPPYNYGVGYEDDPTGDLLPLGDYLYRVLWPSLYQTKVLLRPGGVAAWVVPAEYGGVLWQYLDRLAMHHVYGAPVIWHETFAQYQQRRLTKDYRLIFLVQKTGGELTFNPDEIRVESERQRMGDKRANPEGRVPGMVWKVRRLQGTSTDRVDWHPAQLPPELVQRLVLGWSREGDTVLDPFCGSGNVGLVCGREGRKFVGVDRSQTYLDRVAERLA